MKITCNAAALQHAAAWAARIAPSRPQSPVLAGVRLDASDDGLTLSATDYEAFGSVTVSAALVTEPGATIASAALLVAVAKVIPPKTDVTLSHDGGPLSVTAGRQSWSLPTMDVADSPRFPDLGEPLATVDAESLGIALDRVLPFASRDRRELSGILLALDGGTELALTGADTIAAAFSRAPVSAVGGSHDPMLVPPTALRGLPTTGEVRILGGDGLIGWACDDRYVMSRLMGEKYPETGKFVPMCLSGATTTVVVEVAALLAAAEGAAVVLHEHGMLALRFGEEGIRVRPTGTISSSGQDSDADTEADVVSHEGPSVEVGMNADRLALTLKAMHATQAQIILGDRPSRPLLLRPAEAGEVVPGYEAVVMPMKLRGRTA